MRIYRIEREGGRPPTPGRHRPRSPIDIEGWRPRSADVDRAIAFVDRSGVLPALEGALGSSTGRPRFLSVRALLTAMMLNGLKKEHRARIRNIATVLNGLSEHRLRELGCRVEHRPAHLYKRVDDLYNKLCRALHAGIIPDDHPPDARPLDDTWFANRIGASPITDDMRMSRSVAIDGTDVETAGRFHTGDTRINVDGAASETQPLDSNGTSTKKGDEHPRARVVAIDSEGRNVYTADPDARGGYRTATNRRAGGTFVGYEWHLAVLTRDVTWTNGIDKATLGDEVPGLIVNHALAPAGSHRAKSIVPLLVDEKQAGAPIDDVVCDAGYSLCRPETMFDPLHRAGIHVTYQITSRQKTTSAFNDNAFVLNQHLFSEALPQRLRNLPLPPLGSDEEQRLAYEEKWNEAARYRYSLHGATAANGTTRWRDPIAAGRIRSRQIPSSMRKSRNTPLATIPSPETWEGTVRASSTHLPRWSKYVTGTTAHRIAYGRRQVVESANSALHGEFVDINSGYFRVFERHRINILLAFGVAGYNSQRIRSWCQARDRRDPNGPEAADTSTHRATRPPGSSTTNAADGRTLEEGQKAPPA